MRGHVDEAGRALLPLNLRATLADASQELLVWVDTAFDGELVISGEAVKALALSQSAAVQATLADGSHVLLETFAC